VKKPERFSICAAHCMRSNRLRYFGFENMTTSTRVDRRECVSPMRTFLWPNEIEVQAEQGFEAHIRDREDIPEHILFCTSRDTIPLTALESFHMDVNSSMRIQMAHPSQS
jgi:hypothetical protein